MNSFIEEFYYGNIDPQARSFEQNKKVQQDMQTLTDNEDFLTDKLSGEEKKRFIQYVDAWAAVNGESTLDSFITGFRLGAVRIRYLRYIESSLRGLPERRDITNNPALPLRQSRIVSSIFDTLIEKFCSHITFGVEKL